MTDNLTPEQLAARQWRASIAAEMSRLMAYPESDAETIPQLYRIAVENLSRKESE